MAVDFAKLGSLIDAELARVSDPRIVNYIREYLIEPVAEYRDWDYGEPGQKYLCWIVFKRDAAEIAYCEEGFGPSSPWGIVWPIQGAQARSIGQDSGWFTTFVEAFFDSSAATELPIWRVFKIDAQGTSQAVSEEGTWDDIWEKVYAFRRDDPNGRYNCDNAVAITWRE